VAGSARGGGTSPHLRRAGAREAEGAGFRLQLLVRPETRAEAPLSLRPECSTPELVHGGFPPLDLIAPARRYTEADVSKKIVEEQKQAHAPLTARQKFLEKNGGGGPAAKPMKMIRDKQGNAIVQER